MLPFPFDFAGVRIDGAERAPKRLGIVVGKICAAVVRVAGLVRLRRGAENVALFACGHVEQAGLRVKSGRHPVCRASRAGADAAALGSWTRLLVGDRPTFSVLAVAPRNFGKRARGE